MKKSILLASVLAASSFSVNAAEIKFLCYQDANECDVLEEMSSVWENSTGNTVNFEKVGYDVVRDQLENQLEAGSAPDVARVTNLGGLNQYYLDLTPYVDAGNWEANYGAT
ncbi:MAG: extracellular solute-binding protein, partial [Gammaproteobacteria bacterium]|nr:extracellular solute-binding protein [Gammaproteobacteria bacterium]